MLKGIKNIIFDLGGVIYDIDYHKTINAFEGLGIRDFKEVYAKAGQSDLFDKLETGQLSKIEFFQGIKNLIGYGVSELAIERAWNAMLIDFMPEAIACLQRLKKQHRIFLLSNTNEIHIEAIQAKSGSEFYKEFCNLFEVAYLSHDIGMRKPNEEVFHHILLEQSLVAQETLFIDDSPQHVQGAIQAGLKAYHLKDGERLHQLLP